MHDGCLKISTYPDGAVVLQFEAGYSLHPSYKGASDFLRQCALEVEAHGNAHSKNHPLKPIFEVLDKAGIKPSSPTVSGDSP